MEENSTPDTGSESVSEQRDILTGTSKALFPDLNERYKDEVYGPPPIPKTPEEVTGQERVEAGGEEEASPGIKTTPVVDDLLDPDQFGSKKVKVKVDGVEMEVTFKELLKGFQLERHLTQKGQALGEKERTLREWEQTLMDKVTTPMQASPADDPLLEVVDPYVKPLKQEIEDLKKVVKELKGTTQPIEYQQNLKRVDSHLRKSGYDDFMSYVPEIEQAILAMPIEEQVEYDNPQAFMNLYKDFKIRDLKTAPKQRANPDERPKPKVSRIDVESGSGSDAVSDDIGVKDKALFDRAVETGKTEDWMAVLSFRGQKKTGR
jgi:hypothetical protein